MESNRYVANSFPPHNVPPSEKLSKKWGLQGAKAIWYFNEAYAPSMFYNDREAYDTYLKYSFGEIDPETYKPALGVNAKNAENSFVKGIRWQAKNFATKRIQATVSKIFNRQYDPVVSAVDPTSVNRRESFKASVQMWSEQQAWLAEKQQILGIEAGPDIDLSGLPATDEALDILMQDHKLVNEILAETAIHYHLKRLDFTQAVKEKMDQYLVMLPAAAIWCGLDGSNMPIVKALNPARVIAPKSEFNDYKRIAYGADVDEYTVAEFRNMATDLTEEEVQQAVINHAKKGNYHKIRYNQDYPSIHRDVDTMMIMRFEIATVDEYTFLKKTDKDGNPRFIQKKHDYYRGKDEEFARKYGDKRELIRYPKKTVYGGYWIVDSDIVFGYGEKNYLAGELGYKIRASNSISGYSTCLVKQMIPCLDNLETYDKKIQQLVASIIPNGIKIDLFALRKATFNFRGKEMSTGDLVDMFIQRGILVTDTSDAGSGDARKALESFDAGTTNKLAEMVSMMRNELEQLDEIIGFNRVSTGSTLSPEMGARVAQQMDQATDTNLDHVFRADKDLCMAAYEALCKLHRESVNMNPEFYMSVLGEEAVMKTLAGYTTDELGLDIEARPTQLEWQEFYQEISDLAKTGAILPEDRVALRRFNSLKQAETYLKIVTAKRRREKQQQELALIQENGNVQQASNKQTHENRMLELQVERDNMLLKSQYEDRRKDKDHIQKMEQIRLQVSLQNQGSIAETLIESETQKDVARMKPKPTG